MSTPQDDETIELLVCSDPTLIDMARQLADAPQSGDPFAPRSLYENNCLAEETGVEIDWKGFAEMITRPQRTTS